MESTTSVLGAAAANLVVAGFKFLAAGLTGSAALLSEGFHSLVDTANQLLLLLGLHRSRKPPDDQHPFGYGQELYFWTTVVCVAIFAVGGLAAFIEGLMHVIHPPRLEPPLWNYVALGVAAVAEGTSFAIGYRALRKQYPRTRVWEAFRRSKDPTVMTVVFEDSTALAGIFIAFLGVLLGHLLHVRWLDGAAAMVIGLVLMGVSVLLGRESKSLVTGEAADPELVEKVRALLRDDRDIEHVGGVLTLHFGPRQVLLNTEIEFRGELTADELDRTVDRIEARIREACPMVKRIFVEMEAFSRHRHD